MKTKSKILTLLLALALLCGLFTMIVANAATPEGGSGKTIADVKFNLGLNNKVNGVENAELTAANGVCFGNSEVVSSTGGDRRFRYVATSTTYNNTLTMNPAASFFSLVAPFSTNATFGTHTYFTYEMDVSFENLPATATLSLNARYLNGGKDSPTNGGFLTFSNENGKLAITVGKTTYSVHFDELEWVHIAWVVGMSKDNTSKCPATLFINGEPFYTYNIESGNGFFDRTGVIRTGDMRLEPDKSPTVNTPGSTLLIQNYQSYLFTEESDELAAFARGEKNMDVAPDTYKQVVFDHSYAYPSDAKTAVASVNGKNYATVEEAVAAANGGTVTLLTHVLGTSTITEPCTMNTNGKSFDYTTNLGVTKSENLLTFADDANVVKFVFTKDGEELATKTYGLGAIPDTFSAGLTLQLDAARFYKVDSLTVDGVANAEWTMPTLITEDMIGKTVTVDLVGAKQVLATLEYGSTVEYCEDLATVAKLLTDTKDETDFTLTFRQDATGLTKIAIAGVQCPQGSLYIDINGHSVSFNGALMEYKNWRPVFIYSSRPDAVLTTTANVLSNYNRSATVNYGTVTRNGVTYYGSNLTVNASCLGQTGGTSDSKNTYTYVINGGTYNVSSLFVIGEGKNLKTTITDADITTRFNAVRIVTTGATANVTIVNSNLRFATGGKFFDSGMKGFGTVTLRASGIYGTQIIVPEIDGLSVVLEQGTELTAPPVGNVIFADGRVLARINGEESDTMYRVVPESTTAKVIYATETDPKTGEVLASKDVLWVVGETPALNGDFYYFPGIEDKTKVLVPTAWVINDGKSDVAFDSFGVLSAGEYTVKPSAYEEKFVAFTVTDINGSMTASADATEDALHTATEMTANGLTIRIYTDYNEVMTRFLMSGANMQIDLNGHKFSTLRNQDGFFCANVDNATVYVFSSRPGAQIEMTNERSSDKDAKIEWGGGFAFSENGSGKNITVGRTIDGKTFDRANLTVNGSCLVKVMNSTVIIDSITNNALILDNSGQIQLQATGASLELLNCDCNASVVTALIAARSGAGKWNVVVRNCNISIDAAITGAHNDVKEAPDVSILFENTMLMTKTSDAKANRFLPIVLGEGTKTNFVLTNENVSRPEGMKHVKISDTATFAGRTAIYEVVSAENRATVRWMHGDLVLSTEEWKKGSTPSFTGATAFGDFYFGAAKAKDAIEGDKDYSLALKSKVSKIRSNLTLYSNISFNLYLSDEAITAVTVVIPDANNEGATKTLTLDVLREEEGYKVYKIDEISPKDLTKTFEIRLALENDGKTYTYAVTTSVANYAKSVLNNADECKEGKDLVASLIDYVREAALYFETATEEDTVMQTMKSLLDTYGYVRPTWTKGTVYEIPAGNTLVTGAALNLGNTPGFLFFVGDKVTEVTVKYGNVTKTFTGEEIKQYNTADGAKSAVLVDTIHASAFRGTITVTAIEGDASETLEYNLDTYIQGVMDKNSLTEAPAYAQALYAYSVASETYLNR